MTALKVLTIGHSNRSELHLIDLLRAHDVAAVVDVRSTPYSEWSPQFNRSVVAASLKEHGIAYSYLGGELGVRSDDPSCYEGGRVVYARLADTEQFQRGLRRVVKGARSRRLALMCAEQDPIDCHRSILLAPQLAQFGVGVSHILHPDGELESQQALEQRLLEIHGLGQPNMFLGDDERLTEALARQEQRIAYVRPTDASERRETA